LVVKLRRQARAKDVDAQDEAFIVCTEERVARVIVMNDAIMHDIGRKGRVVRFGS
jgi:hypothetical protein